MKVNWKRFAILFCMLQVPLLLMGCTAQWLGAISALLPVLNSLVSAVVAFVLSLQGKTVPPAFAAMVQKVQTDIAGEITNIQALIAQFQANASTGLLSQISAVMSAIVTNLSSILADSSITDSATVSKITQLVALAVAAAQSIIALIPVVSAKLTSGATPAQLEAEDKFAAKGINDAKKSITESYSAIVSEKTGQPEVDAALAKLPKKV
jgi:hypothetical protein